MSTVHNFAATTLKGQEEPLSDLSGQVVLMVNTASKCSFRPQYEGLEAFYRRYYGQGFVVLVFPCNQFGTQEPGDAAGIARFCCSATYPSVNGSGAHSLFRFLKGEAKGFMGTAAIKWNFRNSFSIEKAG